MVAAQQRSGKSSGSVDRSSNSSARFSFSFIPSFRLRRSAEPIEPVNRVLSEDSHVLQEGLLVEVPGDDWSFGRRHFLRLVSHPFFDTGIGILILANMGLMTFEVDAAAQGRDVNGSVLKGMDVALQVIFLLEVIMKFYIYRTKFCRCKWRNFDLLIVILSWLDMVASQPSIEIPNSELLRFFRVLKLSRAIRLMIRFPELYSMIRGFASAMMAMFWGFVMIILLLLIFAILAVELLNGKLADIDFVEGSWCEEAYSSVWKVTLLFFQNLVAGDSWGLCAIPVIRKMPAMFLLFAMVLVCVQLGFTNLILSSIVESATLSRERDSLERTRAMKKAEMQRLNRLAYIISSIDLDKSGELTFEEFLGGYDTRHEMKSLLKTLDIDRNDISQLFSLMDADKSGTLSYNEFINCLKKAETQDFRVQLMFLKLQVSEISREMLCELHYLREVLPHILGADAEGAARDATGASESGGETPSASAALSAAARRRRSSRRSLLRSGGDPLVCKTRQSYSDIAGSSTRSQDLEEETSARFSSAVSMPSDRNLGKGSETTTEMTPASGDKGAVSMPSCTLREVSEIAPEMTLAGGFNGAASRPSHILGKGCESTTDNILREVSETAAGMTVASVNGAMSTPSEFHGKGSESAAELISTSVNGAVSTPSGILPETLKDAPGTSRSGTKTNPSDAELSSTTQTSKGINGGAATPSFGQEAASPLPVSTLSRETGFQEAPRSRTPHGAGPAGIKFNVCAKGPVKALVFPNQDSPPPEIGDFPMD